MSLLDPLRVARWAMRWRGDRRPVNSAARREGDCRRDERHWAEAAVWYRKHLDEHPDDFAIWVQAGNCLKEATSYEQALAAYRRAIEIDDNDADVYLQLGHLQKLRGMRDDAVAAYRRSLARQPHSNPALDELSALGVVAEADQIAGSAQLIDVDRALRAIDNKLHRLIEAYTTSEANNLAAPVLQPSPPIPAAPQSPSILQFPMNPAARAGRPSIFLLVDAMESVAGKPSDFLRCFGNAIVKQGESVFFIRWNVTAKSFQLLGRDELERLGWVTDFVRTADYPPSAERRGIIETPSCDRTDWLLIPEPVRVGPDRPPLIEMNIIMEAKRLGLRSAWIFHGADLLRLRKHAGADAAAHEQYMQALLLADAIMPVSSLAANDLNAFFVQHQKADSLPLIRKVSPPGNIRDDTGKQWSDYVRRVRGLLTDADISRQLGALYYWIDPAARSGTPGATFARRLARALTDRGVALIPVAWNAEDKRLIAAGGEYLDHWTRTGGPSSWARWIDPENEDAPRWVIRSYEVNGEVLQAAAAFAKAKCLRTATILHETSDLLYGRNPSALSAQDQVLFEALAGIDKVFAVSERRFREFYRFLLSWRGKLHSAEHRFKTLVSPNEVPGQLRRATPKRSTPGVVRILIVAPVDHLADFALMLDAAAEAAKQSASRLIFTVVGSPSDISATEHETLKAKIDSIPEAHWEKETGGERLNQVFEGSDFVIFPGLVGGFASLVTESLWRGLPCLLHGGDALSGGVPGPGVAFADMRSRSELIESILKLAEPEWRRCLANEAIARPIWSWNDYAEKIAIELATDRLTDALHPVEMQVSRDVYRTLVNLRRRPKLSLCISTYNRAGWLGVSLRNIFTQIAQPRDDLEVLVVDNTSADHTPEIVKPYLGRSDFRYVRNPKNVGMLGNLAVTAQRAKGEYIWILGDDDLTRPGTIEYILQIIDRHPGIGLIYLNYGYTSETNPTNIVDLDAFLASYNTLEPAGPDELAPVKRIAAKCENFFSAIYSHVYRRDHAIKSYCQDTSGRIFSTMLSCIPTSYYVLNYMAEEPAYWVGAPSLVVNSNVSWQDYGTLLDLEQLPRAWDLAERMGTEPSEVDRRRANRLWLVEMMWNEIFESDKAGNSAYFSASRVLMRLKHLKEIDRHIPTFIAVYERALKAGHPAATVPAAELFSAFETPPVSLTASSGGKS